MDELLIVAGTILIGAINIAMGILFKTESFSREFESKNQKVVDHLFIQLKDGVEKLNKKTKGIKIEDLKVVLPELNDLSWIGSKIEEWASHISRGKSALRATAGFTFASGVFFAGACLLLVFDEAESNWKMALLLGGVASFGAVVTMRKFVTITHRIEVRTEDLNLGRPILEALKKEEEAAKS